MTDDQALIYLDDQEAGIIDLAQFLKDLHDKWTPHIGQIPIGKALFYDNFKDIFACCGRNLGKTELISYCIWRYCFEHKKSENYIFGPAQKQIKEILWASGRIQGIGPEEYRQAINNTEMRMTLNNGSFVKLDGSDNEDSYRGIKPRGLSVYDEFKDIRRSFIDAYDPNRAAFDSPAIYIGTPPEFHNHFVDYMDKAKRYHGKAWFYYHAPSELNPYISKRWLDQKRIELIESGDEETWLREYMAIYVKGGKRHVFPQYLKLQLVKFSKDLIGKATDEWVFYIVFDPAASSTFGILFVAWNRYAKKAVVFDEIYEKTMSEMVTSKIWARVNEKVSFYSKNYNFNNWTYIYDEAASWFRNETNELTECRGVFLVPTNKAHNHKEEGISIVRDAISKGILVVTDNCVSFDFEMQNYIKKENGLIPKEDDHLIDSLRYFFAQAGYKLDDDPSPVPYDPFLKARAVRLEDELPDNSNLIDFDDYDQNYSTEEL